MEYSTFGSSEGRLTIYFHGAPGTANEASILDTYAKTHKIKVISFDRGQLHNNDGHNYCEALAEKIKTLLNEEEKIDVIGFSIGAFIALEVSKILKSKVNSIHLISAAAPLDSGNYIRNMAGGFVFKLARQHSFAFYLLTQYQKILAYTFPSFLFKLLFNSAQGKDAQLRLSNDFQKFITPILKDCFTKGAPSYMKDIRSYVNWKGDVSWCDIATTNWHGTSDNWSPIAMATQLQKDIPGSIKLEAFEGLSHYSCLEKSAPIIMQRIANS